MGFELNTVTISGRLTRDPESPTQGVTRLSIAHNERRKVGEEWTDVVHYLEITVFGKLGEAVGRDLGKGDPVAVSGTLEQRRWEDKDGGKRSAVGIIARDVMRGQRGGGQDSGQQSSGGYQQAPQQGYQQQAQPQYAGQAPAGQLVDQGEADIPF